MAEGLQRWAKFRKHKDAIKLHTLIDLRGSIPCFIRISSGKVHDVNAMDDLPLEPGAFYVMDRGYVDYGRLYALNQSKAFFITRAKRNMNWRRLSSTPVDKLTGLRSDSRIMLNGDKAKKDYPQSLRRITYYDAKISKRFVFLTNNFTLPALTIAQLYKARWRVELFFKWLKQNLRIKTFYGTSPNAVKTQIWIAIIKKQLALDRSLSEILQILSLTLFEKTPVFTVLTDQIAPNPEQGEI